MKNSYDGSGAGGKHDFIFFFALKFGQKHRNRKHVFWVSFFVVYFVLAVLSSNLCEIIQGGWFFS